MINSLVYSKFLGSDHPNTTSVSAPPQATGPRPWEEVAPSKQNEHCNPHRDATVSNMCRSDPIGCI